MEVIRSLFGFGTGANTHEAEQEADGLDRSHQPTDIAASSRSPEFTDPSSGNSQPANDPRAHIQRLGREYSPEAIKTFPKSISSLFDIIVDQLYDSLTHFILEFLQNLDDTSYDDDVDPSVKFILHKGYLHVHSNQIGFSKDEVEAICSINSSTKKNKTGTNDSIGEKGIGFKSVFRAADMVWLSSRGYHIKWDRNREFGVIAPEWWDEWPDPALPEDSGLTSFCMRIPKLQDREQVSESLEKFDPALLLFLRKLNCIELEVVEESGIKWKRIIRRKVTGKGSKGPNTTTLEDGESFSQYIKTQYIAKVPQEPKRPGCHKTKMILAFPVPDHQGLPLPPASQNVYSGLPISSHGLKFLLQGDFLLTASRQNIDISLPWNLAIRDSLCDAVLEAVRRLNKSPSRFTWPFFITSSATSAFFKPAMTRVQAILSNTSVLETESGTMKTPREVFYVDPKKFSDLSGRPFTLSRHTEDIYVSAKYPLWVADAILALDARNLTAKDFLDHLQTMINKNRQEFRSRSLQWHEELANALSSMLDEPDLRNQVQQLCIVPLSDGTWTSADKESLLWPKNIDFGGFDIQVIENMKFVDPAVEAQPSRLELFQRLGIKKADTTQLCEIIRKLHSKPSFRPASFTRSQLISHAMFLCQASWAPAGNQPLDLWFETANGKYSKGSTLYVPCTETSPALLRVTERLHQRFELLHRDYDLASDGHGAACQKIEICNAQQNDAQDRLRTGRSGFIEYLIKHCQLSMIPRLVTIEQSDHDEFRLSDEFKYLTHVCPFSDLVEVLMDNWQSYSAWIEPDVSALMSSKWRQSRERVIEAIRKTRLVVRDGRRLRLDETCLPALDPLLDDTDTFLPVLGISGARNETVRTRLAHLGVRVTKDLDFYIHCLKSMRSSSTTPSPRTLAYIYEQIRPHYDRHYRTIQSAFKQNELIFYQGKTGKRGTEQISIWVSLSECSRRKLDLDQLYPRSKSLFSSLLDTDGLELDAVIEHASSIATSRNLTVILRTLGRISKAVGRMEDLFATKALEVLRSKAMFPIKSDTREAQFKLARAKDEWWFIADRAHLHDSFNGKVSLLALEPPEIGDLDPLLKALDLGPRRLSSCVRTTTYTRGFKELRTYDTVLLNQRAPFFASLIPRDNAERDAVIAAIRTATVSHAADVVESHTLNYGKSPEVKGRDSKGAFFARDEQDGLKLFVSQNGLFSQYPLFQLVDFLAEYCGIKNIQHVQLLYTCLSKSTREDVLSSFNKLGLHVDIPNQEQDPDILDDNTDMGRWDYFMDSLTCSSPPTNSSSTQSSSSAPNSEGNNPLYGTRLGQTHEHHEVRETKAAQDRRLPLRVLHTNDTFSKLKPKVPDGASWDMDSDQHLKYLGEVLVSAFLNSHLGSEYNALQHWTSDLRCRAGLPLLDGASEKSAFTLADTKVSEKMTSFLKTELKARDLCARFGPVPTYHIDVAATIGHDEDNFEWTTSNLSKARQYRLRDQDINDKTKSKHVMILIMISDIFHKRGISAIVDPWEYFDRGLLQLQGDRTVTASLKRNGVPQFLVVETPSPAVAETRGSEALVPQLGLEDMYPRFAAQRSRPEAVMSASHQTFRRHPGTRDFLVTQESWYRGMHGTNYGVYETPQMAEHVAHGDAYLGYPEPPPSFHPSGYWDASFGYMGRQPYPRMLLGNAQPSSYSPYSAYIPQNHIAAKDYLGLYPEQKFAEVSGPPAPASVSHAKSESAERSGPNPSNKNELGTSHLWSEIRLQNAPNVFTDNLYQYDRLQEGQLRVFTLFPGPPHVPLKGLIWMKSLDARVKYTTVSYVWGPKSQASHIIHTPAGMLKITEPLHLALSKLRDRHKSLVLWVDAICINQNDDDEKTEQVKILAKIFQNSTQTWGFIRSDEETNEVVEMLMQIRARQRHEDLADQPRDLPKRPESWNEKDQPPPADHIWSKTAKFFQNEWFRRVWIIQEVVIAREMKLVCGDYIINWDDLYSVTRQIDRNSEMRIQGDEVRKAWQPFLRLGNLRFHEVRSTRLSILVLLESFRHCQSTLRRDRFFSLLGIAADGHLDDFEPDYKSPFASIARRFTEALFRKYSERKQGMLILYRAGLDEDNPGSPSWMTDWTTEKQSSLHASASRGVVFRAALGTGEKLEISSDGGKITTDAYFVDEIETVTHSSLEPDPERQRCFFLEVEETLKNMSNLFNEEERGELVWKVPIAGAKYPKAPIPGGHSLSRSWEAYQRLLKLDWSKQDRNASSKRGQPRAERNGPALEEESRAYASLLRDEVRGWRFVTTKQRKLCGMTPSNVRKNDAVYIFAGGDVPFITRPGKERPEAQRLIGQGYFHGIMHGEALDFDGAGKESLTLY